MTLLYSREHWNKFAVYRFSGDYSIMLVFHQCHECICSFLEPSRPCPAKEFCLLLVQYDESIFPVSRHGVHT